MPRGQQPGSDTVNAPSLCVATVTLTLLLQPNLQPELLRHWPLSAGRPGLSQVFESR